MALEVTSIEILDQYEEFVIDTFQTFGWNVKSSQRIFNRTTTPDDAISFDNVTFIHSTTEAVNYLRIVFERDKKMPHYDTVKEYEAEYFSLLPRVLHGKPYMPPDAETVEDWGTHFEPELRPLSERIKMHVAFFCGITIPLIIMGATEFEYSSFLIPALLVCGGIAWYVTYKNAKKRALKLALTSKNTVYRTELENRYNTVVKDITEYDTTLARLLEIKSLVEPLIE